MPEDPFDIDDARSHLPSLAAGAYFNTGYCGPLPVSAANAMARELDADLNRPRGRADASEHESNLASQAKDAFASMFAGITGADLVLTDSTTHGIGLFVSGLGLAEGDEILTTDEEHIGLGAVLGAAVEGLGVKVRITPFGDSKALAGAIGKRTRLVVMSHLSYVSGRSSLPADAPLDVPYDVPVILDCAHTPGSLRFDPAASGAAAVAFPGQKWCLGPEGIGGLWISPEWIERISPVGVSFRALSEWRSPVEYRFEPGAARFDGGTLNKPLVAGLIESIRWLRDDVGLDQAISLTQAHADKAREMLTLIDGVEVLSPPGTPGGLVGFRIERLDSAEACEAAAARLWDARVLLRHIENPPGLRASVAWFNTEDEIALLASTIADMFGARA